MRTFNTKNLKAGDYLVMGEASLDNFGFLSTVMYKVGWMMRSPNQVTLVSMSDGMTQTRFTDSEGRQHNFTGTTHEEALQRLCDALNDPELCKTEYRHASSLEVQAVVAYQTRELLMP
jgi:hypothetical protein